MNAKQTVALLANIKFGAFYHEHVFFFEEGLQPLPKNWRTILDRNARYGLVPTDAKRFADRCARSRFQVVRAHSRH
jgi:hypothetical protein